MENHDLNLPLWGPYNKEYLGASHITDIDRGLRFDLNLFPGYYRRSVMCPRDVADCGAKILAASNDLSHFVYRYELNWKDQVYLDADFSSNGNTLTVKCNFVNNTDMPDSVTLNAVTSMRAASIYHHEIEDYSVVLPSECIWVDAVEYDSLVGKYNLPDDGLRRGEKRISGFVKGRAIGTGGLPQNTEIAYKTSAITTDKILVRYNGEGSLLLKLDGREYLFALPKSDDITTCVLQFPKTEISGFLMIWKDGTAHIDGFVIGNDAQSAQFVPAFDGFVPAFKEDEGGGLLDFGGILYKINVKEVQPFCRRLITDDVGQLLTISIHNHVAKQLGINGKREYIDLFLRPIFLEPHSQKNITITVEALGSKNDGIFDPAISAPTCNPEGEKYMLSQSIMRATTLTNVVYPIYCRGKYIRHNTPGRNWDSLYTWDSGFIGMGLLTADLKRAEDCLNAYMMPLGNDDGPFVFHGTPLPTQILLYGELINKTCDKGLAKKYYPYVKAQYEYFSSQKNQREIGMFSLWHLFYNSGGWDDYPTQQYLHDQKDEANVCPVVNTAFTVICAQILSLIARFIGEDDSRYKDDIEFFSNAINTYAWDEESGYYGYVEQKNGKASIYKNMGVNADMGMDGAYPYIAGVADEYRSARILDNIKHGMMTEFGVSMVDLRAPYYSKTGYWNGSVWMPHQWVLWKALLDYGECELANEIAEKALNLWEKEVSATYNCYECFMIENGIGAGFHQFSGLSTPVLMWFESYYKPFSITAGFRTLITDRKNDGSNLSFSVSTESAKSSVIVCLEENKEYIFEANAEVSKINRAAYCLKFNTPGVFSVNVIEKSK
ncbi:MAG: hypothetical protein IJ391_09010 [Clostridia bacterium]|nr:hypothetical protein [Clostridia bacterium]